MVRDGYFYALGCLAAAIVLGWVAWPLAIVPVPLAGFCLWFFRDPERVIPNGPGAIVSCADGKVTDVSSIQLDGQPRTRISIFLNVFNVHVNRSPISGVITDFAYKHGQYRNAMGPDSAELNEQSICTVAGDNGEVVVFKQIAGLIARRIIFNCKIGDRLARGQRVGMIKFGSRCDVLFPTDAQVSVKIGDHVKGGSTVLAVLPVAGATVPGAAVATPEKAR